MNGWNRLFFSVRRLAESATESSLEESSAAEAVGEDVVRAHFDAFLESVVNGCITIALRLVASVIVFLIGRALIHFVLKYSFSEKRSHRMNPTARNFLRNATKAVLWSVLIVILIGIMGIAMASVVTVIASAGAAIALALQGSLSNFAGGVMILIFKPFELGNYIEIGEHAGTVIDVGIFYTTLLTPDNRHVIIPNGSITGASLVNYSMEKTRRIDLNFSVAYGTDLELVKKTAHLVAASDNRILQTPEPFLRLTDMKDSALNVTMRVWCAVEDYWNVKFDLLESMNRAFQEAGVEIPFPQIDVHTK